MSRLFPELRVLKNEMMDPMDMYRSIPLPRMDPRMDIIETKDSFQVKADVPGFTKDQIDIDIQGNMLSIKGSCNKQMEQNRDHYHVQERMQSSFCRSLTLPCAVEPTKVRAELKDGVLQVIVPKNGKASKIAVTSV